MACCAAVPSRAGTSISLAALESGSRQQKLTALRALESGLRADGWVRISWRPELTQSLYMQSLAMLGNAAWCARYRREALAKAQEPKLGLSYLAIGDEPLYAPTAKRQCVRSLNMHEDLTASECDKRALSYDTGSYDETERALAHSYHAWPSDEDTHALREAARTFRAALIKEVARPLRRALGALLGLRPEYFCARCDGRRSDNTSLVRVLEYPPCHSLPSTAEAPRRDVGRDGGINAHGGEDGGAESGSGRLTADWGVSEHTDFELFSLLHERCHGLQLCDPSGHWHQPAPVRQDDECGERSEETARGSSRGRPDQDSWILILGDMYARLSGGYLPATPHRVPPTAADASRGRVACVFFQGLDEAEAVAAVAPAVARRSATGGYREWESAHAHRTASADGDGGETSRHPMTQREWTEWKELAARDRLQRMQGPNAQGTLSKAKGPQNDDRRVP